jgi:hypothetical protein
MGYSLVNRASKCTEYSVNGRDRMLEYASEETSPAAGEAKEKESGQKY